MIRRDHPRRDPKVYVDEGAAPGRKSSGVAPQILGGIEVSRYEWRGAGVVSACGSCDIQSIQPLADALTAAARDHHRVILDVSGIGFADSALLNLLILAHQKVQLYVVAPTRQLQRLLELTGMDSVLNIRATVEEAVA
jgi:anti-anti-sigma factor